MESALSDTAVEVDGLRKAFGTVLALDGLSFRVPAGSVLGLLGPNGSGKTTTVSILIGRLSRLGRARARVRAGELLGSFGLTAAADRLVRTYSGGMRRRLDLAAALLHRPPVLFLDEPTTGLDPESRFALWDSVRELSLSGTAVLLTTQYLEEADTPADQVVIISAGKVADTGTPAQLKARLGTVLFDLGFAGPSVAETACSVLATGGYQPDRDGAGVRVRSAAGSAALTGVLRALEGRAPDPVSVAVREPTLDDVFRSLTEGEE